MALQMDNKLNTLARGRSYFSTHTVLICLSASLWVLKAAGPTWDPGRFCWASFHDLTLLRRFLLNDVVVRTGRRH